MPVEQFANNAATTLAAALTASATTLTVSSTSGFPAAPFRIRLDDELLMVTATSGSTWTVTRALEATSATAHTAGAAVTHILTAGVIQGFASQTTSLVPVGGILPFAGASAPAGFLLCDGASRDRATYADLYAVVGTTYGPGTGGSTTFAVPDLRGRVAVGVDGSANRITTASVGGATADTLGGSGGAQTHTLIINEMPSHDHLVTSKNLLSNQPHSHSITGGIAEAPSPYNGPYTQGGIINPTGGGQAHSNTQPWLALNFIIKF